MTTYQSDLIQNYLDSQLSDAFIRKQGVERRMFFKPNPSAPLNEISNTDLPSPENLSKIESLKQLHTLAKVRMSRTDATLPVEEQDRINVAALFYAPIVPFYADHLRIYSAMRGGLRRDLLRAENHKSPDFVGKILDFLLVASVLEGLHQHVVCDLNQACNNLRDKVFWSNYLKQTQNIDIGIDWESKRKGLEILNTKGYELAWETDEKKLAYGIIYLNHDGQYTVRDMVDETKVYQGTLSSSIHLSDSPLDLEDPTKKQAILEDPTLKQAILDELSKAGHIQDRVTAFGGLAVGAWHAAVNLIPRLLLVRIRRDLNFISAYVGGAFRHGFLMMEQRGVRFFFTHLAWVFFLPRLIATIVSTLRIIFDKTAMTRLSLALGPQIRASLQAILIWDLFANDAAWFSSGLTTAFFMAKTAPAVGLYLAMAMQAYDLVMMGIRCVIEAFRVYRLGQTFKILSSDPSKIMNNSLMNDLNQRNAFERNQFLYSFFINFTGLLICALFMTPIFVAISPWFPIVAATVAVLITLSTYFMTNWFAMERQARYDAPLKMPGSLYCVKSIDSSIDFSKIENIDLGFFSAGYVYVCSNEAVTNILFVDKNEKLLIDYGDKRRIEIISKNILALKIIEKSLHEEIQKQIRPQEEAEEKEGLDQEPKRYEWSFFQYISSLSRNFQFPSVISSGAVNSASAAARG